MRDSLIESHPSSTAASDPSAEVFAVNDLTRAISSAASEYIRLSPWPPSKLELTKLLSEKNIQRIKVQSHSNDGILKQVNKSFNTMLKEAYEYCGGRERLNLIHARHGRILHRQIECVDRFSAAFILGMLPFVKPVQPTWEAGEGDAGRITSASEIETSLIDVLLSPQENIVLTGIEEILRKEYLAVALSHIIRIHSTINKCNGNNMVYGSEKVTISGYRISDNTILACFARIPKLRITDMFDMNALSKMLRVNGSLTSLDIDHNNVGEKGATAIAGALRFNASLTYLNLHQNAVGPRGALKIADALRINGSLTSLNLRTNGVGTPGAMAIADALLVNGSLTSLDIGFNEIGNEGAETLGESLRVNGSLKFLNLVENFIGDEGAKAIGESLPFNGSLTSLDLEGNKVGATGAKAIAEGLRGKSSLTRCKLWRNTMDADAARSLVNMVKDKNISLCGITSGDTTVDFRFKSLKGPDAILLASDLSKPAFSGSLTSLNVTNNDLGDEGWCAIFDALRENPKNKIKKWYLFNQGINPTIAMSLAKYAAVSGSLTSLDLSCNEVCGLRTESFERQEREHRVIKGTYTVKGINAIAGALRDNDQLTLVSLLGNKCDDDTVSMLLTLKKEMPKLISLCGLEADQTEVLFPYVGLTAQDAKLLAPEIAVNGSLTSLDFRGNELCGLNQRGKGTYTAEGIKAIADALGGSKSLTSLNLAKNRIGAKGATAIAHALRRLPSLTSLDLMGNGIGDIGAIAVGDALGANEVLTSLDLRVNEIGDEAKVREAVGGREGFVLEM